MTIPEQVKIGAVIFKVEIKDDWKGRNGSDGEMFYDKEHGHVIYIGEELTQEAQELTFIHEIIHGLNATIDHEFLDSLAGQLYQVFKENKLIN